MEGAQQVIGVDGHGTASIRWFIIRIHLDHIQKMVMIRQRVAIQIVEKSHWPRFLFILVLHVGMLVTVGASRVW